MHSSKRGDIYDWNTSRLAWPLPACGFQLLDETLRDGIQSPSVVDPPISDKLEIVHLMAALGISVVNAGMPGAGPRAAADALAVVQEVRDARLPLHVVCAARTTPHDITPVLDIAQRTGVPIEVYTFIGSSPLRLFAEDWGVDHLLRHIEQSARLVQSAGLEACLVTEDTTRAHPRMLESLFRHAIDLGIRRLCLCDTAGHATPRGVDRLFAWTRRLIAKVGEPVNLDFHGHNDRGLAVINTLQAIAAGAHRVHATGLGIGERVGNAAIDQIVVNLKLAGVWNHDVSHLVRYGEKIAEACKVALAVNYPVIGRDAFRTGTGVHAAAIIKAERKGDHELADRIYSSVSASDFGRKQVVEVGHMSGLSNVRCWLESHGVSHDNRLAKIIFDHAKAARSVLGDDEIWAIVREHRVIAAG